MAHQKLYKIPILNTKKVKNLNNKRPPKGSLLYFLLENLFHNRHKFRIGKQFDEFAIFSSLSFEGRIK